MPRRNLTPTQLRRWRATRGWTQQEAGRQSGYSAEAWKRYEAGTRPIPAPLTVIIRLLDREA